METKELKWTDIVEANKMIGTTKIQNKDYAEVNQRVKAFRYLYPEGTITTEIVSIGDGVVVFKAVALNGDKVLATGHAYEKENSTFINKTSYIENCETSAVGRCLGFLALGIDTSIASNEEVENAIMQQNAKPKIEKNVTKVLAMIKAATTLEELQKIQDGVNASNLYQTEMKEGGMIYNAIVNRTNDLNK